MTARKKVTTKKSAERGTSVKERARRIVADAQGYDVDTRDAVAYSLETDDAETLAETVRRAEAGEIICDTALVEKWQAEAAEAVVKLFGLRGLPDFFTSSVAAMLAHAARVEGIGIATDDSYSVKGLTKLFGVTQELRTDLEFVLAMDAADMLSRLIKDKELLPEFVRYKVACAVTDLHNGVDTDAPDFIRLMLEEYKTKGGEGR